MLFPGFSHSTDEVRLAEAPTEFNRRPTAKPIYSLTGHGGWFEVPLLAHRNKRKGWFAYQPID